MLESWLSGQGREVAVGIVIAVLFIGAAIVFHWVAFAGLNRLTRRTRGVIDDSFVHHARRPARVALVILAGLLIVPWLGLGENVELGVQRLLAVVLTATVGWLAFNLTRVLNDVVAARYDLEAADNLTAREVHTRVRVLQRVLAAAIMVITVSLVLMAIPGIRQIGVTLFASAGVVGFCHDPRGCVSSRRRPRRDCRPMRAGEAAYSYRNDSIGSRREACLAG